MSTIINILRKKPERPSLQIKMARVVYRVLAPYRVRGDFGALRQRLADVLHFIDSWPEIRACKLSEKLAAIASSA